MPWKFEDPGSILNSDGWAASVAFVSVLMEATWLPLTSTWMMKRTFCAAASDPAHTEIPFRLLRTMPSSTRVLVQRPTFEINARGNVTPSAFICCEPVSL
jgi:hypothetical protein